MSQERKTQRMPVGLMSGGHGQKLWKDLTARIEFTDVELRFLSSACFTLDRIQRERKAIGDQLILKGSQGQPVAHPLLRELRADEKHFAELMAKIDIPDEFSDEQVGENAAPRSAQMRAVVASRWSKAYGD